MTEKTEEQIELEEQDKINRNLCQTIEKEHTLRRMLVEWLFIPLGFTAVTVIVYILTSTGVIATNGSPVQIDLTTLQTLNSDIFTATITVIGIIIGIVPLISFFYLDELKNVSQETHNNIREEKQGKSEELKGSLDSEEKFHDILHTKIKKAVKRYTESAVGFSVLSLLAITLMFFYFGIQNLVLVNGTVPSSTASNLGTNIIINITILFYVISEVFPLVSIAFYDVGYKAVRLINVETGEVCTAYIAE